jgi:hypothetical protein
MEKDEIPAPNLPRRDPAERVEDLERPIVRDSVKPQGELQCLRQIRQYPCGEKRLCRALGPPLAGFPG